MKIFAISPESGAFLNQSSSELIAGIEWEFRSVSEEAIPNCQALNATLKSSNADYLLFLGANASLDDSQKDAISQSLSKFSDFDIAYSNSQTDASLLGKLIERPAFSPERLRCQYFLGEMLLVNAPFFDGIQGFRSGTEGSEIFDLVLRASRARATIQHVSQPLYCSKRDTSTDWSLFGKADLGVLEQVLNEHLSLTGGGTVVEMGRDGVHKTKRNVLGEPLVSIIIPTRASFSPDGSSFLLDALSSIVQTSSYKNIEIVLVIDEEHQGAVISEARKLCRGVKLVEVAWNRPFNFSDKINLGVVSSSGEFVLLLNDDIRVISPDWIEALLALAQLPGAGMSGAMLYFADDTIQHAGHAYRDGEASHVGLDMPRSSDGPLNGYRVEREIGGVTAACCLIPRAVFFDVGGFTGLLPGAFNDVDFCMKVTAEGYGIYWTPRAELYHFESKSRDASVRQFEVELLRKRWGHKLLSDPYWPYPFTRPVI